MRIDRQALTTAAATGLVGFACFGSWFRMRDGALSLTYGLRAAEVCLGDRCRPTDLPTGVSGQVYQLFATLAFYVGVGLLAVLAASLFLRVVVVSASPFIQGAVRIGAGAFALLAIAAGLGGKQDDIALLLGFPAAALGAVLAFAA